MNFVKYITFFYIITFLISTYDSIAKDSKKLEILNSKKENISNIKKNKTLDAYNINLTFEDYRLFRKMPSEGNKANMYLLGVLDSSEGKDWCSYKKTLPHSRNQYINTVSDSMKNLNKKQRASKVIIDIIKNKDKCR